MKNTRYARTENERGLALILVVGYLAVLTLFASAFLTLLNRTQDVLRYNKIRQQCANLAEAGIDKAVAELRLRQDAYRGEENTPLGGGRFSVAVEREGQAGFRIRATGEVYDRFAVQCRLQRCALLSLAPDGKVRELNWLGDES